MLKALVVLAVIGLTVYALLDCLRAPEPELRGVPRAVWVVLVLLLTPVGPVLWLAMRRDNNGSPPPPPPRRGPMGPDDDPDFLRRLGH